jgi:hypothetical protein
VDGLRYLDKSDLQPRDVFLGARKLIKSWTWYGTYPEACALVTGYLEGRGSGRMLAEFQSWLVGKYGGALNVVFWIHVLRLALPNRESPRGDSLTKGEHAAAVDKLFELLIEWLDESNPDVN